ncbi:unnamed protein product [Caenorhabditis auriculariae]|uniref:Carboxylic ester hydrolase n=1 Tax=Caenorhabditis auriculariae TaxID=2777116 RepID=A0A8S1H5T8_9PELO|nr:unnamed protein product [Caenorhabditis auriculariae]
MKVAQRFQDFTSVLASGNYQAAMVRAGRSLRERLLMGNYLSSSRPSSTEILNATCGPVRGNAYQQEDGRFVDGYLGIPYAKPPVGELRFKKPEPHEIWSEPRECQKFGPRCPQNDDFFGAFVNIVGKNEAHCLTLNVFAPRWQSEEWKSGFPVMVFIHGGGFSVHSSSNYGDRTIARNLCVKDVVVVSINYRLGILGFFTTGDDVCKGNFGLWDQTLALKWVQEHIASFGGDPKNVTIFGQSAGGASVDLLSLSPHSRDLFQRVIPMAGCGECDFAYRSNEQQATLCREYLKFIGWDGEDKDTKGLLEWLKNQSTTKLEVGITPKKDFRHSQSGNLYFVPNYDGDFFPKPISQLRKEAPKKQIMAGTTEFEGLFFVGLGGMGKNVETIRKFAKTIYKECDYGVEAGNIQNEIYEYYTKDLDPKDKEKVIQQLVHFVGDCAINVGMYNYAKIMTELGHDVYFYSFDHFNPNGFGIFKWFLPFLGATHCIEIRYILGKGLISKFSPDDDDRKVIHIMTTLFTNFAKYGDPNPLDGQTVWEKQNIENPYRHLQIKLPAPKMVEDYQARRAEFWDAIRAKNITRSSL